MAVLGRLLISSGQRLDLPDISSIESYTAGDFKYLLKGLVGSTTPYILKGFDVIDPDTVFGQKSCSIRIADSVVFYPSSSTGAFFHGLPEGNVNAQPLVPDLRTGATNYVYATFTTFNTAEDSRSFWDPDKDAGAGGEFAQDINTESALTCQINVSVGAFPSGTIPIAKITTDGNGGITYIEDARDLLFRLGTGGINPDPYSSYSWRSLPDSTYQRNEPPTIMQTGGINPFYGADKNIYTLKEWMDVVMSKLKELGGTTHWYDDAATYSTINIFRDTLTTTFKSKGSWTHDASTSGYVYWNEDINIKSTADPRTYILRGQNSGYGTGSVTMADEQVAYLNLIRNQAINSSDLPVDWINGQPYVNTVGGSLGLFANLAKGDWIKKAGDADQLFLRVEEFYDSTGAVPPTTTPALAKSIRLSGNYAGTTAPDRARFDKGVYTSADVIVSDRDQTAISSIGGNFSWLVVRSDVIQNISNIATTTLTIDITGHDGSRALVTSTLAHGLIDGDRVVVSGSTNFNGTYKIEVESTTTFYIEKISAIFNDEFAVVARYATVTTSARSTSYGLQLESAPHGFASDETITISNAPNYNGTYQVNVTSSTNFTIPVSAAFGVTIQGDATAVKVIVRAEQGIFNLIKGESVAIGDVLTQNIKQFLGMTADNQTSPQYHLPAVHNMLYDMQNWNTLSSDDVTLRLSKLTAMMADKAQDKTVKYLVQNLTLVKNTTSGSAQELTFFPTASLLTILQPGGIGNATVTLPTVGSGVSLLANQVAYISINRNIDSYPTISVIDRSKLVIDENVFVIASRLAGAITYLWDGTPLAAGQNPVNMMSHSQARNAKMIKGGTWSWTLLTNTLTWTSDAFIQLPGVTTSTNTIPASSSIALDADGKCLYVIVNMLSNGVQNLSVVPADIASIASSEGAIIIARRVSNAVMVGNSTILLIDGESKELESGLSVQNRALIGASVTEATSNPGYAARGAVNRITNDSEGILEAVSRHDAEFDKYFGQLRMIAKTAGNKKRVRVTGSDRTVFTSETIGQEISSLMMSFTGAEIDFSTGNIYGGDATLPQSTDFTTPLGINFIPTTITAGQYSWYSITVNPSGTNSDNTVNIQFNILGGSASGTTPNLATKPALGGLKKLGYVVVKDNGAGGSGTVLDFDNVAFTLPAAAAQAKIFQLGVGSGSGGGSGLQKVTLYDPISTVLPTGAVTVDGISVIPTDLVLFSNLSSGNNKIYKAVGTVGNITSWQSQYLFNGSNSPTDGDLVVVQSGTSFADTIGIFNGTNWVFNNKVRYFNGLDYWEVSSLNSAAIANNTGPADVFSINWLGSENIIVDYSISRGTAKETGSIVMTTDGTYVGIATTNVDAFGAAGVVLSGAISGSLVKLQYTSDNSGSSGTIKFIMRRWSDGAGGPGGIPSYSGGGGSSITGSGSSQQIGIWSSPTNITGNSNFNIDTAAGVMKLGSGANIVEHSILQSTSILSGVNTDALLFTYSTSYTFAVVEYSVFRGAGNYRIGTLLITQDASANINVIDTYSEISSTSITFASPGVVHTINGSNVEIRYTTSGGVAGTFKYAVRRWS